MLSAFAARALQAPRLAANQALLAHALGQVKLAAEKSSQQHVELKKPELVCDGPVGYTWFESQLKAQGYAVQTKDCRIYLCAYKQFYCKDKRCEMTCTVSWKEEEI